MVPHPSIAAERARSLGRAGARSAFRLSLFGLIVLASALAADDAVGDDPGGATWERRGPVSGSPLLVGASPVSQRLYAVGTRELYRSDDGGVAWSAPTPFTGWSLVADAADPDRLYTLLVDPTSVVLAVSDDAGATFAPVVEDGDLIATTRPGSLAVGRGRSGTSLLVATGESALLTSVDGGRHWRRAHGLPEESWARPAFLAWDPTMPGRLYVTEATLGGLFSSADDGLTFVRERLGLPLDVDATELAIDPVTGRRVLLASERNGLRQALNWQPGPGLAWRRRADAVPAPWRLGWMFRVDGGAWRALGRNRAGDPSLFGSADGRTWRRLARPMLPFGRFGGTLHAVGGRLLAAGRDGLFLSSDDGRTWAPTRDPFRLASFTDVAFDSRAGATILADGSWASFDGGARWERTDPEVGDLVLWGKPEPVAGLPRQYLSLAIEPQEYSCRYAGFAHSTDRGRTWTVAEPYPGAAFALTPSRTDRNLLMAGITRVYAGCPHECNVVRSRDRGATFDCLDEAVAPILGLGGLYDLQLAADDETFAVLGEGGWMGSRDAGEHWAPIAEPAVRRILARGPAGSGVAYGRRGPQLEELVRTIDGGASWQPLAPPPGTALWVGGAVLDTDPDTVALHGLGRQVVVSRDGGATWHDVGADLPPAVEQVSGIGILDLGGPTLFVGADAASGILAYPLSEVP